MGKAVACTMTRLISAISSYNSNAYKTALKENDATHTAFTYSLHETSLLTEVGNTRVVEVCQDLVDKDCIGNLWSMKQVHL